MYLSNISKEEFYKNREETMLEYEQKKIATADITSQITDTYFEESLQDEQLREDELLGDAELVIGHSNRINAHSTIFPQTRMVKYKKNCLFEKTLSIK